MRCPTHLCKNDTVPPKDLNALTHALLQNIYAVCTEVAKKQVPQHNKQLFAREKSREIDALPYAYLQKCYGAFCTDLPNDDGHAFVHACDPTKSTDSPTMAMPCL